MISVIGGTYKEINLDSTSIEIFGSGLRCAHYLLENKTEVKFHTSGNSEAREYLKMYRGTYKNFDYQCRDYESMITFKYSFALDEPTIYPSQRSIVNTGKIEVEDDNIVCYGMMESEFSVAGKKVVYDPQTSIEPIRFREFGQAEELVYIVNANEAKSISGLDDLPGIREFFFENEKVLALIIKDGPNGATLYENKGHSYIPAYLTDNVHKIGSGDIFTSSFSYYWIEKDFSLIKAAELASKSTALFCDKNIFKAIGEENDFNYVAYESKEIVEKQVYLASPIFSLSDLILVDKIREAFLNFGLKVFSPFHDIGLGSQSEIAIKDLEGLRNSDIVFGVLDGLDSGTLIELGYSMAKNKKIIGYHRTNNREAMLMLTPSRIKVYDNLTTAIYHTVWNL